MKRIVVATDLSKRSDKAVGRAARLANELAADLTVVHVVDVALPLQLAERISENARQTIEKVLHDRKADIARSADIAVKIGDPIVDIPNSIEEANADLLVLGLHRERDFLELLKETTMERLIRMSDVPVLLASTPADTSYRTLLAAVDMSKSSAAALRQATKLASDAKLVLFHAFQTKYGRLSRPRDGAKGAAALRQSIERDYRNWLEDSKLPANLPEPRLIDASPAIALDQMLASTKPDLLVLGANARSNLGRFLLGSFTAGLVRNPPCDLLVGR